ncbi:hypothetical protein FJZ21_02130 [Candidatus Pacearchaeota archaeon]|nr:hypothetical protein [Candidatus Pacearchaeota archaeon]
MPPIKEIRKLSKEIKEVPKVESIDDEFDEDEYEDSENDASFFIRRSNKTSTLESSNEKQDTFEDREDRARPDNRDQRSTVNFYAGGSGANPYKSNAYTPVGSAESSGNKRDLGERDLGENRSTRDDSMNNQGNSMERNYAGEQDQNDRKDRRRNLM